MKKFLRLFSLVLVFGLMFAIASCGETTPKAKEIGIEVSELPTKTEYVEGQKFDATGMIVEVVFDDETKKATDEYTFEDKVLALTDTKVVITYKEFTAEVNISVVEKALIDIEVSFDETSEFTASSKFSDFITYQEVYNDGSKSEAYFVTEADIQNYNLDIENQVLTAQLVITTGGQEFVKDLSHAVTIEILSISELKAKEVSDEAHLIKGILIGSAYMGGTATSPATGEFLFKDELTSDVIGIRGFEFSFTESYGNYQLGDAIMMSVKVINASSSAAVSEANKVCAELVASSPVEILSHGNQTMMDLSTAIVITNQEELNALLGTAEARAANSYKLIKFVAGTKIVNYSSTNDALYITFDGTSAANVKIDGFQPYIHSMNQTLGFGDVTALSLLAPNAERATFPNGNRAEHDFYVMYVGGIGAYYHQFKILASEYVTEEVTPVVTGYEYTAPTKVIYEPNETLDFTGGKIAVHYLLSSMDKEVGLEAEMLKEAVDMTTEGEKTATFVYEGHEYEYRFVVSSKTITSIEMNTEPTKATYAISEKDDVDFTGATIKVNYSDESYEIVNVTSDICVTGDWLAGSVTCTVEYLGFTTTFSITVEFNIDKDTINVRNFASQTAGTTVNLYGIVIGPVSVGFESHLLLKDVETMDFIQVRINDGNIVTGPAANPVLNTEYFKVGDKVVFMDCPVYKNTGSTNSSYEQIYGKYIDDAAMNILDHVVFVERETAITYDLSGAIELDQTGLQTVLADSATRATSANKLYKLTNPLVTPFISKGNVSGYHFWFDSSIATYDAQKVNAISPYLYQSVTLIYGYDLATNFGTGSTGVSRDFANPIQTNVTIYAIYVGGNNYYHAFQPLAASWICETGNCN